MPYDAPALVADTATFSKDAPPSHPLTSLVRHRSVRCCTSLSCTAFLVLCWIAIMIVIWVLLVHSEDEKSESDLEIACSGMVDSLYLGTQQLSRTVKDISGMNEARQGNLTESEFNRWLDHTKDVHRRADASSRFWEASYDGAVFTRVLPHEEREQYEADLQAATGHGIFTITCTFHLDCRLSGDAPDQPVYNVVDLETNISFVDRSLMGIDLLQLVSPNITDVIAVPSGFWPGVFFVCAGYPTGHLCVFANLTNAIPILEEEYGEDISFSVWDLEADICFWNCNSSLTPYGEQYRLRTPKIRRNGWWGSRNFLFSQYLPLSSRKLGVTCSGRTAKNLISRPVPIIWLAVSLVLGTVVLLFLMAVSAFVEYSVSLNRRLKNVARESQLAQRDAVAADRAKAAFLACMSHEIRTPLNGILGAAHLLRSEGTHHITRDQCCELEQMEVCGDMLECMVDDILDYCKLEDKQVTIFPAAALFNNVIDSSFRIVKPRADANGVLISYSIDENVPECFYLDRTRLRQVVLNLLANAVKFTPSAGSVVLHASFEEARDDACHGTRSPSIGRARHGMLSVTVSDTGVGISEEGLSRIFNAFEQADVTTTRKFGGSGLGLAIAKSLIELMGGTISATSVVSEGSVFRFDIPIKEAPKELVDMDAIADDLDVVSSSILASFDMDYGRVRCRNAREADMTEDDFELGDRESAEMETLGGGEKREGPSRFRALIVDDNPINRKVASRMLESLQLECAQAHDGAMSVEMTMREKFDIIFMDCYMPGMDGYEAAMAIRDPANPNCDTPIVALSADAFEDNVEHCRECGMMDFLPKPLKPARLKEIVSKYMTPQ